MAKWIDGWALWPGSVNNSLQNSALICAAPKSLFSAPIPIGWSASWNGLKALVDSYS
jgi:hypothetical protein